MEQLIDLENIRQDFPILQKKIRNKPYIYLDTSSSSLKPKPVIEELYHFYLHDYATVGRGNYDLTLAATKKFEETRHTIKEFLHAREEKEIIFTRGTTDSINMMAFSLSEMHIKPGDEIILSQIEHHANIVPWQMLARKKQAKLKFIPINEKGELLLDEYKKLLSPKTKLVAITHMANSTGTINPVKEISKLAHEKGALVLVDGAQAIAHMKVDVQEIDADFYVFSAHKMYGPNGVGVLYGKKEILDRLPPVQVGGGMIEKLSCQVASFQKIPGKFEAGTPPVAEIIAFKKAIEYLEKIGRKNIYLWEKKLLSYLTEKMEKIPYIKIIGTAKEKGGIISFIHTKFDVQKIGDLLNERGIAIRVGHHCAMPVLEFFKTTATARISFGLYNTLEEMDSFTLNLEESLKELGN